MIGAEIDYGSSATKRKQKLQWSSAGQMEKELLSSDPNKLQSIAVNTTRDRKISK
jgi:hypothetical protein